MTQISILKGIYADGVAEYRTSYPRNMLPIAKKNGISAGYLKQAEGIAPFATSVGIDRGGIVWKGIHYRVSGSKLITVAPTGVVTVLGDVGAGPAVSLDYSFVNLVIGSAGNLFYWDGAALSQVTDPDLGVVVDCLWLSGYTVSTDGASIVVTEINNPMAVDPLKYGSSEANPDPIVALRDFRNELYALNRFTIEVFDNVGGSGFPFAPITGAQITKGCVGTQAACIIAEALAFMGGGEKDAIAIYIGAGGKAIKISDDEVERRIAAYTEDELKLCLLESRKFDNRELLYVHLPGETWVYDVLATQQFEEPIWYTLHSDVACAGNYRAKNFVYAYNKWYCGDKIANSIGLMDDGITTQYGDIVGWQFDTAYLYNASKGAIIHALELVATNGNALPGTNPGVFMSWTKDGRTWSDENVAGLGAQGSYSTRTTWQQVAVMDNYLGLRFRGADSCPSSFSRLEAQIEALYV